jgi:cytochrome P450
MAEGTLPPGPHATQLRQTVDWVRRGPALLEECARRYGVPFTARLASGAPFVILDDPEAIREVFTGDPEVLRSGEANRILAATLGPDSVLVMDGREHLRERKLMLPPFHGKRMQRYGDLMAEIAREEIARWPAGGRVRAAEPMRAIALEVIARAVFGVAEADQRARLARALSRLLGGITKPHRVLGLLLFPPGGRIVRLWQRTSPALRRVDALILEEVARGRSDPRLEEREDILSLLLQARTEDGEPLSDAHLRDELMTMLIAGHETTAVALAWALERLARHPGAYDRLASDGDEYADAVVKETLRIRPVIPFALRLLAAPMTVGGREYPAGVRLAPCAHLVHRRADIYSEPGAFRPERFLERPAGTYTWIPFGGGIRRCLGGAFAEFEMRTVLREVARSGRILPAGGRDEPVGRRGLTSAPANDATVVWEPAAS